MPRKGLLELVDGGTLFIDELQNISAKMQEILGNITQGKSFCRVGDTRERMVDIRFIFASNVKLEQLVREGKLKEDFYSRIQMHTLVIPPLRTRLEDVPDLAKTFVDEFYAENLPDHPIPHLTPEAVERLQQVEWPYNIRSLRNVIRRTLVHIPGCDQIRASDLIFDESEEPAIIVADDIKFIIDLSPRSGSQRIIFDKLLESYSRCSHIFRA